MATATKTALQERGVLTDLRGTLKKLAKDDPARHQALLVRITGLTKEFSTDPVPPVDETRIWLADEPVIVKWIRGKYGGTKIRIISGLEPIRIFSPQDFLAETLNVHRKTDPQDWLTLEEKLSRAVADGSDFGWRELIFCYENCRKIHPSWWSHWQYFAKAIVEIDDVRRVGLLDPDENGCSVLFYPLDRKSHDRGRFPLLATS